MRPRLSVSSERLEKPEIEPTTPGLGGEQLNHSAKEASENYLNNSNSQIIISKSMLPKYL